MAYMCKKNDICIGTLHIHLRPSLRASTIPGMASPIISLLSSSCDLIGGWKGEAHCRGRKERSGEHTHTHITNHTATPPHTHTHRESLLFAVHHTSRFQLHTTVKLFTTQAASTVLNSRYDEVFLGISLRASPHLTSEESRLGYVSAKVRFPPVCY